MAEAVTQQKVLVYGATGLQAQPVATKLLNAGHSVCVLMFSSNVDLEAALEKMPIELTSLETWVTQREGAFSSQTTKESIK